MQEILDHYEQVREDLRLTQGWGLLESARTQELILERLAKPPGKVLDVGGAAGIYSAWLGSLGYETHLIDPVSRHVERARANRARPVAACASTRGVPSATPRATSTASRR